jgi:hypothetical protein
MELIVKYFFLANILFLWGCIAWKNTLSLGKLFRVGGGCLRLESSCIQVNTDIKKEIKEVIFNFSICRLKQ